MMINYRITNNTNIGKWSSVKHDNKDKLNCDKCNAKLWTTPPPCNIYCNSEHDEPKNNN